ncbi:MAG: CapA family protein [Nocardioides sp.]|uniref:CapA family protein n=1 Tax=Nocardioides sp. TaxID=35761 RepID=UPI003F05F0C1
MLLRAVFVAPVAVLALLLAACTGQAPAPRPDTTARSTPSPQGSGTSEPDPGPAPPRTEVLVLGDVMLGRRVHDGQHPVRPLRHLAPLIGEADLAVANLECTLSDAGPPQQGGDSFVCPGGTLRGLERLGFDALSLANNHTGDFGTRALVETVRAFDGSSIQAFGAGEHRREAGRASVLTHEGVRFGFLAFNAIGETHAATRTTPGALSVRMPPRTGPLDRDDLRHVTGLVRELAERVDVVVVLPHWGTQYTHTPEPVQSDVARALARAGADLVVGGHPHWVQGFEQVGDTVVVHSLGNAVFDMDFMSQTMEGVALTALFDGAELTGLRAVPYRMDETFAPVPLEGADGRDVLTDLCASSIPPRRVRSRPATPGPLGPCGAVVRG